MTGIRRTTTRRHQTPAGLIPRDLLGVFIVFAGAAQLAGLQLIGAGAPAIVTILTAWMINLRFTLYSASLAPHFKGQSTRWKALLAYLLTDQAYAVSIIEFENRKDKPGKHWFYFGAAVGLWLTWQVGTALGVFLGTQVPVSWSLDFAILLTSTGTLNILCLTWTRTSRVESKGKLSSSMLMNMPFSETLVTVPV